MLILHKISNNSKIIQPFSPSFSKLFQDLSHDNCMIELLKQLNELNNNFRLKCEVVITILSSCTTVTRHKNDCFTNCFPINYVKFASRCNTCGIGKLDELL